MLDHVAGTGRALAELAAILLGVGCIIGAFSMTGLAGTLANDLVYMAGGAPLLLLVMGAAQTGLNRWLQRLYVVGFLIVLFYAEVPWVGLLLDVSGR